MTTETNQPLTLQTYPCVISADTATLVVVVPKAILREVKGVGKYELNWESIKPEVLNSVVSYLLTNGFSQSIADASAGKKGKDAVEATDAKFKAICTGTVGTRTAGDELSRVIRDILASPKADGTPRLYKDSKGEAVKWSALSIAERAAKVTAVVDAKEGTPMMAALVEARARIAAKSAVDTETF